jgi:hypothetical protein
MTITPYLYYQDVERALKFLARAFGFRKFGAAMRGPDGRINHAAMKLGRAEVMMGRPGGGWDRLPRLFTSCCPGPRAVPRAAPGRTRAAAVPPAPPALP